MTSLPVPRVALILGRILRVVPLLALLGTVLTTTAVVAEVDVGSRWAVGDPILSPGPEGSFDEVAVKDPSIVFFEETWHLFYTARSKTEYTTGYVSAKKLTGLQSAPRHELRMIRGESRYGCAPQIFYFEPQRKWYLIFQNRDSNYQPAFSTTATIPNPESWNKAKPLLPKDHPAKWIDFWVICDRTKAYLFYTQAHKGVIVRATDLESFPNGWGEGRMVFEGVHEAVHVYKVKGRDEYHMIYELNKGAIRSYGLAVAGDLAGSWRRITDSYASGDQLEAVDQTEPWTEMVSHGEVLRSGSDAQMEYEPENCLWLIQGLLRRNAKGSYPSLPWKLGIMRRIGSQ